MTPSVVSYTLYFKHSVENIRYYNGINITIIEEGFHRSAMSIILTYSYKSNMMNLRNIGPKNKSNTKGKYLFLFHDFKRGYLLNKCD